MATLQDIAVKLGASDAPLLGEVIKDFGILSTAITGQSNNGLIHRAPKILALPTAQVLNNNGSMAPSSPRRTLETIQIPPVGVYDELTLQDAEMSKGANAYWNQQKEIYAYSVLEALEKAMIYGSNATFGVDGATNGFYQTAVNNSNVVASLGGASGSSTSIYAVSWKPGETQIVVPGLTDGMSDIDVNTVGNTMIRAKMVGNGSLQAMTTNTTTGAKKFSYGALFYMYAAFQASNKYSVAAINQIDSTHKPTAVQIQQLLDAVRAKGANTILYVSRTGRNYLSSLRTTSFVDAQVKDVSFNTLIGYFNGSPVVVTDYISDAETTSLA